ncbi:MAG: AmmeMemoRadiSam system protein B [Candidatus Bipolaricaulota bacterium]
MSRGVRPPVVAGAFYPEDPTRLREMVQRLLGTAPAAANPSPHLGLVVPHAGYPYSGAIAGKGFRFAAERGTPDVIVFLGANHTGRGPAVSLSDDAAWATPLGTVPVDDEALAHLESLGLRRAPEAFAGEHAIEVELPFVQVLFGDRVPILPVSVQWAPLLTLRAAATAIASAFRTRPAWFVVSSDFTHYEPDDRARARDARALDRILAGDEEGLHALVARERLSICGAGALVVLLSMSRHLDLSRIERIAYATSGDATGDREAVVGYAAVGLTEEVS